MPQITFHSHFKQNMQDVSLHLIIFCFDLFSMYREVDKIYKGAKKFMTKNN